MKRTVNAFVVAAALASFTPALAWAAKYSILDLGMIDAPTFDFTRSNAVTLNDAGQVLATSKGHAYRTQPNGTLATATDLGTVGGPRSAGYGINSSGQAAGVLNFVSAFRTTANGVITGDSDLGTFGGNSTTANGINDLGQVVGSATYAGDSRTHAYRTISNGSLATATDLGGLGTFGSSAYGINATSQTVGFSTTSNGVSHAFRTAANGTITADSDLGAFGPDPANTSSYAYAINASGQVAGYSVTGTGTGDRHAFRTAATGKLDAAADLGTLGGYRAEAYAINDLGQVVGYSFATTGIYAFFVDVAGPMIDLNTLIPAGTGWELSGACGINASGQISGYGTINGQQHAFLLTLTPEPASLSTLVLAAAFCRRRRAHA